MFTVQEKNAITYTHNKSLLSILQIIFELFQNCKAQHNFRHQIFEKQNQHK